MKVVILCGGQGTRLGGLTENTPKPMVLVGEQPILWHIMKLYASQGFTDFVLCLGHKGHAIKDYFLRYDLLSSDFTLTLGDNESISKHRSHEELKWRITFVDTGVDNMTGSRVAQIEPFIEEDAFFLTYGDGLADIDVNAQLAFHRKHGRLATVTGVRPLSRFGELIVKDDEVIEFSEKPQVHEGYINGGFFVLNRRVFEYLSTDPRCTFEHGPLEDLTRDRQLMTYRHPGMWHCMDTPRDYHTLNQYWKTDPFWKVWE